MGNGNSKPSTDIKSPAKYYDAIAVHYILTQNFKDLNALTTTKGCNKLVILTEKVLKKFLSTKNIKYLAQRIKNGNVTNNMNEEKLTYIKPPVIKETPKRDITGYRYKNEDGSEGTHYAGSGTTISLKGERTKSNDLDVKDRDNKERMCKGIAKFYVRIAHIYAAMMKSVNPIYKYNTPDGKEHEKSLLNRDKIPQNAKNVTLSEINLCNRRINALTTPQGDSNKISVSTSCSINKKSTKQKFSHEQNTPFNDPQGWGETNVTSKTLGEEPGIKDLFDLYKDKYIYLTGKWGISKEGYRKIQKDTKTFYKAFTGKTDKEYNKWNPNKQNLEEMKTFKDIVLVDYHNQSECQKEGEGWRRKYVGDSTEPLFAKYADNLQKMLKNAETRQAKLLGQLDKIFDWFEKDDEYSADKPLASNNKYLGLKKDLTDKKLDKIVIDVRDILVEIYLGCEREYKVGLQLFEAIVTSKTLERDSKRNMDLESNRERSLGSDQDDSEIKKLIGDEITNSVKENITEPVMEGMGGESKKAKGWFS